MKIKLDPKNADRITAELKRVNGRATEHTYNSYDEISHEGRMADWRLSDLGIPVKDRVGARFAFVSGKPMPNAYEYTRKATRVVIERFPTGWFVVGVSSWVIYQKADRSVLTLTPDQDALVVRKLRERYTVAA